jgi:hypothetical protein
MGRRPTVRNQSDDTVGWKLTKATHWTVAMFFPCNWSLFYMSVVLVEICTMKGYIAEYIFAFTLDVPLSKCLPD